MKFEKGKRYLVKYRPSGSKTKTAEFVATALSPNDDGRLAFSGRPAFGTAYLDPSQIIAAERTQGQPRAPK